MATSYVCGSLYITTVSSLSEEYYHYHEGEKYS